MFSMRRTSSKKGVTFHVDDKSEIMKMKILRNKINSRNFHINEKMTDIYHANIGLQNKIDTIMFKGSGNYDQNKMRPKKHLGSTPSNQKSKGSLHYQFRKREAVKIDNENLKIAQRIINQKSTLARELFEKENAK